MRAGYLAAAVAVVLAPLASAQPVADHLHCIKVKDPSKRAVYRADLTGLGAAPGCQVKMPATLLCVDTAKTNVTPPPVDGGVVGAPTGRFLCYVLKCPKRTPATVPWHDQFGTRTLTISTSKLLCAPEIVTPPSTSTTTTATTSTSIGGTTSTTSPCANGGTACGNQCVDTQTDVHHCGTCATDCLANALHAQWACQNAACVFQACEAGYFDLDGDQRCEYPCTFRSPQELCNGLDDNCNGQIDENVVRPSPVDVCGVSPEAKSFECTTGVTITCQNGAFHCTFPPGVCSPSCAAAAEVCDGADNNCNGGVNEGNVCPQGCIAQSEVCDGCDNDCNGIADDGIGDVPCGFTGPGEPASCQGVRQCGAPQAVTPGACAAGGGLGPCVGVSPQPETCNQLDDDCDGIVDDNIPSSPCEPAGTPPGRSYGPLSACKMGLSACVNGATVCTGYVGPTPEVCDGIDNDCNGVVDDGAASSCVSGSACIAGACTPVP